MATQLADERGRRDRRLVILVSEKEKREIEGRAREAEMSVSDWLRTAGEQFEIPTEAEKRALRALLAELEEGNRRLDASFARLRKTEERWASFDEVAFKRDLERKLTDEAGDVDWEAVAEMLELKGKDAA
jgi:hypothetical protein